ncbi:MAG: hypothetical protein K9K67_13095 [Bacteriovoracaceae bacterium]|nr:hypothetical protein [Bacteriovoracaceae bacterium]
MVTFIVGCKSDVKDKSNESAKNELTIESLRIDSKQSIRESNSLSSVITKKYYSLKACLAENALGQKLDRRKVEVVGSPLRSNMTDTSGCIFWDLTIPFDYTGKERCKVLSQNISIPGAQLGANLNYAIDTITDEVSDLSRGKGCTVFQEENISADVKNDGGELILERVKLYYIGEQELKRSDERNLRYRTSAESCLKSRVTNFPLARTSIEITIKDIEGIHPPIIINDTTDESGCFTNQFDSPYEQFKYSHWLKKDYNVTIKSGPLRDSRVGTTLYLNPYEPNRLLFGIDAAWDDLPPENPVKENNRIHIDGVMYIQIGNDQNQFKVNDFLGLTVSKSYQVVLNPRLDLGHRFAKDKPRYVKMHDGQFRLKFMLLAPEKADIDINENNFRNFTYITGAEKIVTLKDGVINSRMNIPVRLSDLPRLAVRSVTVFKLEPIKPVGLQETLVTGFFKAKIAWIKTNVFQSDVLRSEESELEEKYLSHLDENARKEFERLKERNTPDYREAMTPQSGQTIAVDGETENDLKKLEYKQFIEGLFSQITDYKDNNIYGNPAIFEDDSPKGIFVRHLEHAYPGIQIARTKFDGPSAFVNNNMELPKNLINTLYQDSKAKTLKSDDIRMKALLVKICRDAFPIPEKTDSFWESIFGVSDNPEYMRCAKNPKSFFETKFILHSQKVDRSATKNSNGLRIHVSSRFSTQASLAETEYLSKRVGADAGLKFPFGEFFGMGVKLFDVSYTWSESESYSQASTDDVGFSKEIIGESFTLEVEGTFEKCILVRGKEYIPSEALRNMGMAAGLGGAPILLPRQYNQYNKKLDKNFYVCDSPEKMTIDEVWYYIQDYVPSSTLLRDAYGPTEIKLIKVFRGESTLAELKKIFEDETKVYMATRTNNTETPDIKLYKSWGHLLKEPPAPSVANKLLINNFEGSFPGTIQ